MSRKFVLIVFALTLNTVLLAQELSEHLFKDRVQFIIVDDITNPYFKKQKEELIKNLPGMKERKLITYIATPKGYKKGLKDSVPWHNSTELYEKYSADNRGFEIILIGLDGGVKKRETEVFKIDDIFNLIDGMPMRRAEIRNRQN